MRHFTRNHPKKNRETRRMFCYCILPKPFDYLYNNFGHDHRYANALKPNDRFIQNIGWIRMSKWLYVAKDEVLHANYWYKIFIFGYTHHTMHIIFVKSRNLNNKFHFKMQLYIIAVYAQMLYCANLITQLKR